MSKRSASIAQFLVERPLSVILFILGLSILLYGMAVGFPFYWSDKSVLRAVFEPGIAYTIACLSYVISGAYIVWGSISDRIPYAAMIAFLSYISLALFRLFVSGPDPFIWVFNTALGLIAAVVFIFNTVKRRDTD